MSGFFTEGKSIKVEATTTPWENDCDDSLLHNSLLHDCYNSLLQANS